MSKDLALTYKKGEEAKCTKPL